MLVGLVAAVVSPSVELYARDDDEPGFPSSGDRSEVVVSSTTPYSGMVDPAPAIVRLYRKMPNVEAERTITGCLVGELVVASRIFLGWVSSELRIGIRLRSEAPGSSRLENSHVKRVVNVTR